MELFFYCSGVLQVVVDFSCASDFSAFASIFIASMLVLAISDWLLVEIMFTNRAAASIKMLSRSSFSLNSSSSSASLFSDIYTRVCQVQ